MSRRRPRECRPACRVPAESRGDKRKVSPERPLLGAGTVPRDPDLRARRLHRADGEPGLGQVYVFSVKLEGFPAEPPGKKIDPLVGDGARFGEIDPEAPQFVGLVAAAEAEDQPSPGEVVGKCDVPEQPGGLIERRQDHGGAEPDAYGLRRHMPHHHQRRRGHGVVGEMMFGEPGNAETGGLRGLNLLHGLGDDLRHRLAAVAAVHQIEDAEIHGVPLGSDRAY